MNVKDFEIMAPVGSRDSLVAALQAGADSVYFGIGQLNMRSHSANHFTIDDLREIAATCREAGVKTYLTVNTIIYDGDIPTMHQIVDAAREAGISAVIACDVAVMQYCLERGVEVHLSTQLNISNVEALKFYAQFADVVVLARELNIDQVSEIHRQILEQQIRGPRGELVRIEMFCHGALCMAVSGKCYMSLHDANRSANRGECIQICRRSYILTDAETGNEIEVDNKYLMSPKDLKTIRFIDRLMQAGVRVFKIEGRARGPEYVYTVVRWVSGARASLHRSPQGRVGRASGSRVQPWLLGRLLSGSAAWRMEQDVRLLCHRKEGLHWSWREVFLEDWRGRVHGGCQHVQGGRQVARHWTHNGCDVSHRHRDSRR